MNTGNTAFMMICTALVFMTPDLPSSMAVLCGEKMYVTQ